MSNVIKRNSNIELLRIIAMLTIIAHHLVVNSGIMDQFDYSNITPNLIYLQLLGMWGKTAINCFVMITGYFMCTSKLTIRRYAKIFLEAKFYQIVIFVILGITGYDAFSGSRIIKVLFSVLSGGNTGFTGSFLAFYLFIPFMNVIIHSIDRKYLKGLIILLLFTFTVKATVFFNTEIFNEVFWYITLYFIAAYFRLYAPKWSENNRTVGRLLLINIVLAHLSILLMLKFGSILWFMNRYFFLMDSHKILALTVGMLTFLYFKNITVPYSGIINKIASTTFGVFCIHAHSAAMRQWLWKDLLQIPQLYTKPLYYLIGYSLIATIAVFVCCAAIDLIRIKLLEPLAMRFIEKHEDKWTGYLVCLFQKF